MSTEVALAVDLGGTKVDAALVSADGRVVRASVSRASTGRGMTHDTLAAAVRSAAARALGHLGPSAALVGAGVGSAGPIDLGTGTVSPVNLPGAAEFRVVDVVQSLIPAVPVALGLDGACVALAEQWVGAARGVRNSLSIVVSTGIGSGLVLDGRLVHGASGNAGHLGQLGVRHRTIFDAGVDGITLEANASGTATVAGARARGWVGETGEDLAAAWAAGDPHARDAVLGSASVLGKALAGVAAFLDLELIVIGGGFSRVGPGYVDLVREVFLGVAPLPHTRAVRIVPSGLDDDGPLIGAARLVPWQLAP